MVPGNAAPARDEVGAGLEIGGADFNLRMLEAVRVLQSRYIARHDLREIFNQFILEVLALTSSEYAFVGEVLHAEDGHAYLKIHDISHIARDEATRKFFDAHAPSGAEFHNLQNLFGAAILRRQPVIANEPRQDSRWGGRQPHGHPPMHNFLGLPFIAGDEAIGLVGLANRPGGYSQELVEAMQPVVAACTAILQAHRDARSRLEAEKALRDQSRLYQALVERSSEAISISDAGGKVTYASPSTPAVIGYSPEELVGTGGLDLVLPEDRERARDLLSGFATGGAREIVAELRFRHKDGGIRWLECRATNYLDDPGIRGIVCNYRDITERKAASRALEASEARFRTLSESVPVILWTTGTDGKLDYISHYWFEYTGVPEGSGEERWAEVLHPEDWEAFMADWARAVASGTPFSREFRVRRASDGAFRWHLARAVPVRDSAGEVVKWLGTSVDVHEQKAFDEVLRVKESLSRQSRLLESVLESMGDAVAVADTSGRFLLFNNEGRKMLNLTPEGVQVPVTDLAQQFLIYREDGRTPYAVEDLPLMRALRGKEVLNEVILMVRPGQAVDQWVNVSARPIVLPEGSAAIAVFQDITLRKRAELALARQAKASTLRAEVQTVLNGEGRREDVLGRAAELLAGSLHGSFAVVFETLPDGTGVELSGSTGTFPRPPGRFVIPMGKGRVGHVAATRKPYLTNNLPTEPNTLFQDWVRENGITSFAGFPLLAGADLLGVVAVFSKEPFEAEAEEMLGSVAYLFSEGIRRRRIQDALRESEERFRTLVDGVQDYAIFLLDLDGRVASWNAGAERITGYSKEEIAGQGYGFLYPEVERIRGLPARDLDVARGSGRFEAEDIRVAKGGRVFWATVHIVPIRDAAGAHTGYAHVIRDITEKRSLYEALKDRTRRLESLNKELEAFSYSVSHDLRAPLRSLDGFSRALEEELGPKLDEGSRSYLGRIRRASERMGVLIDALLDLSRLNRTEIVSEELDFTALVHQAVRDLQEAQPGRQVAIHVQEGLRAYGDRAQLERLLANLLGNAWKFTGPVAEPAIEVGAELRNGGMIYHVRDNGVGFDMAYSDKLFGAFQRLHGQNEFPGTGIGLALAQRIVKRHQGEIWAESAPGQGATFYFTLASKGATA